MTSLERIDPRHCGCDAIGAAKTLIPIDSALTRVSEATAPIERTETVPLTAAAGRVLAAPVKASAMAPPFDNAAMDGYALDASALRGSGPWWMEIQDRIPAGRASDRPLAPMSAARVFTGAPVPKGASAVVMQEAVHCAGAAIRIDTPPANGLNIRTAGSDLTRGQTVLESGCRVGPSEIAVAAAAGAGSLCVRGRARVALLVTGDEIRRAGASRAGAEIWDVNTPMLSAALASPASELVQVAHGADKRDDLSRQLADLAARVDLIVTTGGISVGEEDHVKPAMAGLGAEILFTGVAVKPGKPVSFGRFGRAMWIGLPGNPLSALVVWHLFGTALLRRLTGQTAPPVRRRHVVTQRKIRRKAGRYELRPATLAGFDAHGREVVRFDDATHSGRVGTLPAADGVIFLPAETDYLPAGALVEFQPFRDS